MPTLWLFIVTLRTRIEGLPLPAPQPDLSENLLIIIEDDGTETCTPLITGAVEGLVVNIAGHANTVRISRRQVFVGCDLNIFGDRNKLDLGLSANPIYHSLFHFAPEGNDRTISIGAGFSGGGHFRVVEDRTSISVGENCLFSWDIVVMASDYHAIHDASGRVINRATSVHIGSKVWVGCKAIILKDTHVPDGSIVAAGSVVTKRFTEPGTVIGGNPAKVINRNIRWTDWSPHLSPDLPLMDAASTVPRHSFLRRLSARARKFLGQL
jgi:acetyltransferase-like isoleucine patch superfamily enzyme